MQAIINAVRGFLPHLGSRVVRLMCNNEVMVAYIKNKGGTQSYNPTHATDDTLAEVVRSQGDQAGAIPSTRSAQRPGGCTVQDWPDSQHRVDNDHGTSTTSVFQVGRTADRNVCYVCQQTTDQVCVIISGPLGRVDGRNVHYGRGLLCVFPPFKLVPQVLQKIYQPHGVQVILVAPKQETVSVASGTVVRRSDPAVCQRSATAHPRRHSAWRRDGNTSLPAVKTTHVETLGAILRTKGHSREAADMMSRSLRQSSLQVYESHWEDSSIFVGQNDGKSSMSEVIISVHISCIYSETDCFHRPPSHIARQWLLCCVIGSTILQRIRTSSCSSGHSGGNDLYNAELCLSGIYI